MHRFRNPWFVLSSVVLGGIGAIRRRRLVFLHGEARFVTRRFTGGAAVLWGILFVLTGLALMAGGVAIAVGRQASLRQLVMEPGAWLLAGGIALLFVSAASLVQRANDGEHTGLRVVLALPGHLFGALGVLLAVAMASAGLWGLEDPNGLRALGMQLQTQALVWLDAR